MGLNRRNIDEGGFPFETRRSHSTQSQFGGGGALREGKRESDATGSQKVQGRVPVKVFCICGKEWSF